MATINEIPWEILNKYFTENPHFLTDHHLKSYNDFFDKGLSQLFKERNPIHFLKERVVITTDDETRHIGYQTSLGESIPVTYDEPGLHHPCSERIRWRICRPTSVAVPR